MDEISNKTLATLLVVAIVISLAGTFFAMRGVSQVTNLITGAQSATGTAKVNITETAQVTLLTGFQSVNFGAGYRNTTVVAVGDECNLSSNDLRNVPACWINDSAYYPKDFILENNGNVYVNVTINSSTWQDFIGTDIIGGTARYGWRGEINKTSQGCNFTAGDLKGGKDGSATSNKYFPFTGSNQTLCLNLSPDDGNDDFNISINVSIPAGPTGIKTTDVVFTARKNY